MHRTNRLIALLLIIFLMAPVTAISDSQVSGESAYVPSISAEAVDEEPTFIITIPSTLNLNDSTELTITASDVDNLGSASIVVTAESANNFNMVCGTSKLGYTLSEESVTFTENGEKTLILSVGSITGLPAGEYTDTITFTASVSVGE